MSTDSADLARAALEQTVAVHRALLEPGRLAGVLAAAAMISDALRTGGKLILFGNGGSASDASHLAAEFVGRFVRDRRAFPALSLSAEPSSLTAIANDYGFDRVFARQLEAFGAPGDVAMAISTSGQSANVLSGVRQAKELDMRTIGLTGARGGELAELVELCVHVPSEVTARIQEGHIVIAHVICELVERELS